MLWGKALRAAEYRNTGPACIFLVKEWFYQCMICIFSTRSSAVHLRLVLQVGSKITSNLVLSPRLKTWTWNMMKEIAISESLLFHSRNSFPFLNINLETECLWFHSLWNLCYYMLSLTKILAALFTANLFNFQGLDKVVLYSSVILHP